MSASLVGSEMCIRDSCNEDDLGAAASTACKGLASASEGLPMGMLLGVPVSYTHLTLPTICSV
eukprot:1014917-Alexandrium_andersonii.AAC.1